MISILWSAVIVGALGFLWIFKHWMKQSILPTGPKGWPLVGNAFQQDSVRPHITWSNWAKKYGDVMTIYNFGTPLVLCNTPAAIWECFVSKSNDFAGRPNLYVFDYVNNGGIAVAIGDFNTHWVYRKKVFLTSTKMYGDGLDRLETVMMDIISELVDNFQKTKQEPFDPLKPMQLALCNTLSLLLLGDQFQNNDTDFLKLMHYVDVAETIAAVSPTFVLINSFPLLHYLPLRLCRLMDEFVNGIQKDWIPRMIQKRRVHYDANNPGCILDAFLKQHETDLKTKPKEVLEMRHVIALCQDMFMAGMMTSTSVMYNMIAILTSNPEIQANAHAEIDKVLGELRPKLQDKQSMPYFQAVLEEVLRYATIAPGIPHKATIDSSICGHFIPKGTQVWANIWHLCHDPDLWEDPWTFKPERFLDDNGEFLPADHPIRKNVLVFGGGRRVCAGEQLARNRVFLITTSLLQNFEFKPAADNQLPQCDPHTFPPGLTFQPNPYKIRAIPRV